MSAFKIKKKNGKKSYFSGNVGGFHLLNDCAHDDVVNKIFVDSGTLNQSAFD
jgi:hypothetical protein